MTFEIEILNPAKKDIQEAVRFYESRVTGLGSRFIEQLRKASSQLRANPYYEIKYKNVRTIGMSIFPYLIHFIVLEEKHKILILAIVYAGKKPLDYSLRDS